MAIRLCPPERMLIAAQARTPCFVKVPMCIVTSTALSYKRLCCKRQLKRIHAGSQTYLSSEALTGMPHLLRVRNLFLRCFMLTLYAAATEIDQMGPLLSCNIERE